MTVHFTAVPPAIRARVLRWRGDADLRALVSHARPLGVAAFAPIGLIAPLGESAATSSDLEEGDVLVAGVDAECDRNFDDPRALAERLRPAAAFAHGTLVVVLPLARVASRWSRWSRWFGRPPREAARGTRGAALLLAGFSEIGGARDAESGLDLAWGEVPITPR